MAKVRIIFDSPPYVTYEGVGNYEGNSGRHEYNRRDSIKVDLEVLEWDTMNIFAWLGIGTCIGLL